MKKATDNLTAPKQVGIWIRVSTEDQAKGESPEHHLKRAEYYAESKGWKVREIYHLEGVSGKSVGDHPETKRMLADIKRGHITGLIFSKLARLARDTRQLLNFADYFKDAGADLISLQESIDTSSPAGRFFYTMISGMAQWEREEIADRVAASVGVRAKMGKSLGGQAPFGYQWKDKKLVVNPDESLARRRLYELFVQYKRKKTVARLMNEAGYRTRNGSKFSDTTVTRLLTDPTAKGKHRLNYTKSRGDGLTWDYKPENEWEYVDVEPIISPEVWDQCNNLLVDSAGKRKRMAKRSTTLFSGLTFCHCGQKMYLPGNSPKYTCQKCRNKIPADDLESVYVNELKNYFTSHSQIEKSLVQTNDALARFDNELQAKQQELQKVHQEREAVYRLHIDGKISADQFAERYQPLDKRKKELGDEIARLEAELACQRVNNLSAEVILEEASTLYGRWNTIDGETKRRVVESITDNIIIETDSITVNLKYIPSTEDLTKWQRNLTDSSPRRA